MSTPLIHHDHIQSAVSLPSVHQFASPDRSRPTEPLFVTVDPKSIQTVQSASEVYLSLLEFVKSGIAFDEETIEKAASFIDEVTFQTGDLFESDQILFELVPNIDHNCRSFTESILLLLNSPIKTLMIVSLNLLFRTLYLATSESQWAFIESSFFCLLPVSFQESPLHIVSRGKHLMRVISDCLMTTSSTRIDSLANHFGMTADAMHHTILKQVIDPLHPFFNSLCRHWRYLSDDENSVAFTTMLHFLQQNALFHDHTLLAIQTLPITLTISSAMDFFSFDVILDSLVQCLLIPWPTAATAEERGRAACLLKSQLEEGCADIIEQFVHAHFIAENGRESVQIGKRLANHLGANHPVWAI
ncbi:hypothetical protein BLNAU_19974 [Blattamonas nauphoetae]|uniref:Uncharacterized protein n=1 Tax=Blattamonas nauphoetae TaxID=2049346 RepID=A0ABQ9X048_9EUKA|nr:hypothetical protein BLNAU_19974 [Blattamonas nauphoetae]